MTFCRKNGQGIILFELKHEKTGLCLFDGVTPFSTLFQLYRGAQVLLVEEIGGPGENHRPVASH